MAINWKPGTKNEGIPLARIYNLYSVKQKFIGLLDALPITTVGRGLAPAGGGKSQICTVLRRIRAMLWDIFSAPAEQRRREQAPALRYRTELQQFDKHLFDFISNLMVGADTSVISS